MAAVQIKTLTPRLPKAVLLQRLSRLLTGRYLVLDPAALFNEPFHPAPGARVLLAEPPGRLYVVEADCLGRLRDLPEEVSPEEVALRLSRRPQDALDDRFLPLDHPEGTIARFNTWFYLGKGELAFAEGQVPTGLARDVHLIRAEAGLIKRLAEGSNAADLAVLKLGAGCDVDPVRLLFEALERLDAGLADTVRVVVSDVSPPLVAEARRRAGLDGGLAARMERGQLSFEVLDARNPEVGGRRFVLIQSSYLYDTLPQRELARLCGHWFEFKTRPRLLGCTQREEFRRLLLAGDLAGLHSVSTHRFGYLDWEVALDPLAPQEVPFRAELEEICAGVGDVAVPLGDALVSGLEVLLPHLAAGGVVQTFDLGIAGPELLAGRDNPHLKPAFKGPHRICAALFLGQNFALAQRVFARRGLRSVLQTPDAYLEEMLGEEAVALDQLWEALHKGAEAIDALFGEGFLSRFRGCLEGEGGSVLRRVARGNFLTRSEAELMAGELSAAGADGAGFVHALFAAKARLGAIDPNTYWQFRLEGGKGA